MRNRILIACNCVLLSTAASAQTPSGSWDRVVGLARGDRIRVTTEASVRIDGRFADADESRLHVDVSTTSVAGTRAATVVPRSDVRIVERFGRRSFAGTALGVLGGLGAGVLVILTVEPKDSVEFAPFHELPVMLMTTSIGAGVGGLFDALRRPRGEVVYVAPPAAVAPHALVPPCLPRSYMSVSTGAAVFRSSAVDGNEAVLLVSAGTFIAPAISISAEVTGPVTLERTREGAGSVNVPDGPRPNDDELRRLTSLGFHQRKRWLGPAASVLLGVHTSPVGRARVGFVGGLSVRRSRYSELTGAPTLRPSGAIEFGRQQFTSASTAMSVTLGFDVRVGLTERFALVPQARVDLDNRWTLFRPSIGVQYVF